MGRFFLQVPWPDLLSPELSCELKLRTLTDIINLGLNTIMPERSTKVHETDRPWLSVRLKQLIARRQKAFASGNQYLFKILRNKVNRERKRCRKVYYENKVEGLRASRPRDWTAFSHLYPGNKVEIRSEHHEYQTTEVRQTKYFDLDWCSLFDHDKLFIHYSIYINIYR